MPRRARKKRENYIYHIMCRSISEVQLFKNNTDKEVYLNIVKRYKNRFMFKLHGYCLMGNHVHLMIDCNGADISRIMQGINLSYVIYFNKKYDRHGHLFQDRFKSKVVIDDLQAIRLIRYIHRNPMEYKDYETSPEKFEYSSLGVYLGIMEDKYALVDKEYILLLHGKSSKEAILRMVRVLYKGNEEESKNLIDRIAIPESEYYNEYEYRSERKIITRNSSKNEVINFIVDKTNVKREVFYLKNDRKSVKPRAIYVFLMRCFCNYSLKSIAAEIGNLTLSQVSYLSRVGNDYMSSEEGRTLISAFISD